MKRLKRFLATTLIGGIVVVLPAALMIFVVLWVFGLVASGISPLTDALVQSTRLRETLAKCLAIAILLTACFVIGLTVRTRGGKWIFGAIENHTLKRIWGYSTIRETVGQLMGGMGGAKGAFSTVALVQVFGNDTLMTAFVTDTHDDGWRTVFVPTGPNPTSGNIYHVPGEFVHVVDIPVDQAMRSIISCGAGSAALMDARDNGRGGQKPKKKA